MFDTIMGYVFYGAVFVALLFIVKIILWILTLRRVVPTNEVHIIQSSKTTKSFGKDTENGNTYYEWPSWIPKLGITKIILPVSVFDLDLHEYEAYDKGRLPFVIDVKSFFRIDDSNLAAQRVASFADLKHQLQAIVQGAVRTILASSEIEHIMQGRSEFGEQFTTEVREQLKNWGVTPVKNIELMDIRDAEESRVIHNIMEKKKSLIEMQSRSEVAENIKKAQVAEINAQRETEVQQQDALQKVGERKAETDKAVGIAMQQSQQAIAEQAKITTEKEMEVTRVADVKQAEIIKQVNVVRAEQDKQTKVVIAEGDKQKTVLDAEALLESKQRESQAIGIEGQARADAEKAMQLAPVEAQIVLAKEIGENHSYQTYLVTLEKIKASQAIGIAQAASLEKSDLKIIVNSGNVADGINKISDVLSASGGTSIGSMLEGLAQSETGKAVLDKFTGVKPEPKVKK
jgi:flotillin